MKPRYFLVCNTEVNHLPECSFLNAGLLSGNRTLLLQLGIMYVACFQSEQGVFELHIMPRVLSKNNVGDGTEGAVSQIPKESSNIEQMGRQIKWPAIDIGEIDLGEEMDFLHLRG